MSIFSPASGVKALGLAALVAVFGASPAFAHAHLIAAVPAAGGVSAPPSELDLQFSEAIDLGFSGVTLTGPAEATIETGAAFLAPGKDASLVVPLPTALAPGDYAVHWHVVAADGHKSEGSFTFTIRK